MWRHASHSKVLITVHLQRVCGPCGAREAAGAKMEGHEEPHLVINTNNSDDHFTMCLYSTYSNGKGQFVMPDGRRF